MSGFYRLRGKRYLDIGIVLAAAPLIVLVSFVVFVMSRLLLGKPVLFSQRRAGFRGRPFTLYKFRSMRDLRDASGVPLPDAQRSTPFGRFVRSTSLDELPAVWNVLRGEMSLVGPRPLPVEYNQSYDAVQSRRLEVQPGMAGYAALFGRNAQPWESIFERDVWYVQHISFGLDLKIMLGIVGVVMSRKGIDRGDHNRDSEFQQRIEAALPGNACRQTLSRS
jgi:lipopolysaccharide/colanic/teichoic acid biosynthesis glycosyltransferase